MAGAERGRAPLALARGTLDRQAELRADPLLIDRLLADPHTRVLPLVGGRAPVRTGAEGAPELALRAPQGGDADCLVVFLGAESGTAYLVVAVPESRAGNGGTAARASKGRWSGAGSTSAGRASGERRSGAPRADEVSLADLRSVGADLPDRDAGLFATAVALSNWHLTHGHCPRCGARTEPALAGWTRRCRADGSEHYPRTDPAVIMSVVDDDDRLLLARGAGFATTGMSVLAGFVEPGESLAAAVVREVAEEVGVAVRDVRYVGDQPWPFPSSLMVAFATRAVDTELRLQAGEIESARWFDRGSLAAALADGSLLIPPRVSVARRLIEQWYGRHIDVPDTPVRPR